MTAGELVAGWTARGCRCSHVSRRALCVACRFVTDQHIPRPESYYEDVHTAASQGYHKDDPMAQILYSEIAAAAESGWDFTARYFQARRYTSRGCSSVEGSRSERHAH